jgi:hypothetical protein
MQQLFPDFFIYLYNFGHNNALHKLSFFSLSFNNRLSESEVREPGGGRKGRQVSIFAVGYDAQRLMMQIYDR